VLVHQGVRVEEVVTTTEEDVGELGEEGLQVASDDLLFLLVDEIEDDLTGLVGVGPLSHLDGILDLSLAQLEEVLLAVEVVQLYGVGDLRVEELVWVLLGLDQLLVMVVKGVSKFPVLTLTVELEAEREQVLSHLVIEVEQLGVLAQGVHNHLGHARVEVDPWNKNVLVDDILELTVSEKDELLRCRVDLLSYVSLLSCVGSLGAGFTLTQDLLQLINAFGLFDLADDLVALFDQVADDLLQETHASVLARVPEVVQVVLELLGG